MEYKNLQSYFVAFLRESLLEEIDALLKIYPEREKVIKFLKENYGWDIPADANEKIDLSGLPFMRELISSIQDDLLDALDKIQNLQIDLKELAKSIPFSGANDAQDEMEKIFPGQFLHHSVGKYLEYKYPKVAATMMCVGALTVKNYTPQKSYRKKYLKYEINLQNVLDIVSDPGQWPVKVFDWEVVPFDVYHGGDTIVTLKHILEGFGAEKAEILDVPDSTQKEYTGIFLDKDKSEVIRANAVSLEEKVNNKVIDKGIQLSPTLKAKETGLVAFANGWELTVKGDLSKESNINLYLNQGLLNNLTGNAKVVIRSPEGKDIFTLGDAQDSLLALKRAAGALWVSSDLDFGAELIMEGLTLIFRPENADSFLAKILPGMGIGASIDLTLGVSYLNGLYVDGAPCFEVLKPIQQEVGPAKINSFSLKVEPAKTKIGNNDAIGLNASISFASTLGPVSFAVERLGMSLKLDTGDLTNVEVGILQPTGVGVLVNAGGITGGGFIKYDEEKGIYSGALGLRFGDFSLAAIGVITTRRPNGTELFSMLINIGVVFNPPIPLFMGFTLMGVGGLIGIHRSMNLEALREGIKKGTLDSILFPDPSKIVENADKIIGDMQAVFPSAEGRYVVGPMIKLGWGTGTATVITGDIGIFIEMPDPVRVVMIGQVEAALPTKSAPLIEIHFDIFGQVDFSKKELVFMASLYNSRLVNFDLYGDSAFLLGWGDDPRFALSMGGFHPAFTPPSPASVFAGMRRLTVAFSSGALVEISCSSYLAITSNSLQFGASASLSIDLAVIEVEGKIGFDGLIIYSPFYFQFDIRASLYVSIAGISVCGLSVSMSLSGPTPWNVRGTATIDLWLFSIDVDFNHIWGSAKKVTIAEEKPALALITAVNEPKNWSAQLALDRASLTHLRDLRNEAAGQIVVHPGGTLEFRQNVLPLATEKGIERFGNAPLSSPQTFDIKEFKVESDSLGLTEVKEFFAKGQYFEMDTAVRLSAPSFEKMKAGVSSGSLNALKLVKGATKKKVVCGYEPLVLDEEVKVKPDDLKAKPSVRHQTIVAKMHLIKSFRERSPLGSLSAKRTAKTKMRILVKE